MLPTAAVAGASAAAHALGARIRILRRARRLTLVHVADRAGLSHPFLSQVERGLANPSMTSLGRIALALGVGVVELLDPIDGRDGVVSRVLRGHEGVQGPYGSGTGRLLGPERLGFVPLEFTGNDAAPEDVYEHAEVEFLMVLDGVIDLDLDDTVQRLRPRDSAVIAGGTRHRWSAVGGRAYRLLVVKEGWGTMALRAGARGRGGS